MEIRGIITKDEEIQEIPHAFKRTLGNIMKESREIADSFFNLLKIAEKEGALSIKQKELICLGIALCIKCESCIVLHTESAIKGGATKEDLVETCGVALMMGGSPVMPYTSLVLKSYDLFSKKLA